MKCCGISCFETNKHVIYLIGQKSHKDEFMQKILEVEPEKEAYSELNVTYKGTPLVIQSCDVDTQLQELNDMHSKLACGVVYLAEEDKPVSYGSYTLFVLIGSKSKQVSEDRLTVASVVNDSYAECKEGFNILISNLTKH